MLGEGGHFVGQFADGVVRGEFAGEYFELVVDLMFDHRFLQAIVACAAFPRAGYKISRMLRIGVLAVIFGSAALAAGSEPPTIDQSLSAKSVSGAQISPDGRYVAYSVQKANWDDNDFVSQIWIAVTATGEHYQLTTGKKSSTGPQ